MSITKILSDKNTTDAEKLTSISEIVAAARNNYGNSEVEIPAIKVNTAHGYLPFVHLEDDSKVEVLRNQAMSIKAEVIAFVEENQGAVANKKVEELLATNPFFTNVAVGTQFEYL